jgi:hypothetical protein
MAVVFMRTVTQHKLQKQSLTANTTAMQSNEQLYCAITVSDSGAAKQS